MKLIDDLNEIRAEYARKLDKAIAELKPQFHEMFKPFFETYPEARLVFTAYTPYFNDGDECVYGVNSLYLCIDPDAPWWDQIDLDYPGSTYPDLLTLAEGGTPTSHWHPNGYESYADYLAKRHPDELAKGADYLRGMVAMIRAGEICQATLHGLSDDIIKGMFGDHVEVTITATGVQVDDYDHD
jgi:hypothetical protein